MLLVIQRKATGHLRKAIDATTTPPKLKEWFGLGHEKRIDMLALDPETTTFSCLFDGYLTVVEGVTISRDSLESRCNVISSCVIKSYNYNIFSVLNNNLIRDFVLWDF